ncbi:MAG: DUF1800 family protein [Proteobacteria bacterium]|nr:DUF1800 family protein [Pseudomonadota bacterium]
MKAIRLLLTLVVCLWTTAAAADNITVYSAGSVVIGQTRQLTAYVPLSPATVVWSVNGISGGDGTVGTVSSTGLYLAPSVPPAEGQVSVRATSTAYPEKYNAVTLKITYPAVQLWSISPSSGPAGAFTISLNGSNFTPDSIVQVGDVALNTNYVSPTTIRATGTTTASQAGKKFGVKVIRPGLGGTTSSSVTYTVAAGSNATPTPEPTAPPAPTPGPAIAVSLSPNGSTIAPFATRQFTATVTGTANISVVYSVNNVIGGNADVGTISPNGLYTAPAAGDTARTFTIRAASAVNPNAAASATITVAGPPEAGTGQGTANLAAARLLEQATFGPTVASIARVREVGVDAWLNEQFAAAETPVVLPEGNNNSVVRSQYISRLSMAEDQLRQRVAYALGQIVVISMNKNIYPNEIVPYLQILSRNAFGNYRTLLGEISTSAQMGKYLDIANSNRPANGAGANENYPRELLQLFSIGLWELNPDGTQRLDANQQPIPTYDQTTVQQIALALTGWTYAGPRNNNWEDFSGPMQPKDVNHDMRAKSFLGCSLPANQTAVADMDATLDCVVRHPNIAPFISTRLIRSLVTSNPSPAYIGRVSAVFNNNGSGVKGDLRAVVRAILTDPEARSDAAVSTSGRLRDPTLHLIALVRALGGRINPGNQLSWEMSQVSQMPLTPPSVFGFYAPTYRVPNAGGAFGPEFQIYSPTEAVLRGNLFWRVITNPGGDFTVDMTPFTTASNAVELIDRIDQALMYGRMPQAMRQSLANVMAAQSTPMERMQIALYLTAVSGLYAVQY